MLKRHKGNAWNEMIVQCEMAWNGTKKAKKLHEMEQKGNAEVIK